MFRKRDVILFILVVIVGYVMLIVCILWCYCKGKDVYKFNYILFFKFLLFLVVVFIFYVILDFDREIIK